MSTSIRRWPSGSTLGTNLSYTRSNSYGNAGNRHDGIIYNTLTQSPLLSDGFRNGLRNAGRDSDAQPLNPVSLAELNFREKRNSSFSGTLAINIKPIEGLVFNLNQTYFSNDEETHLYYPSTVVEGNSAQGRGVSNRGFRRVEQREHGDLRPRYQQDSPHYRNARYVDPLDPLGELQCRGQPVRSRRIWVLRLPVGQVGFAAGGSPIRR